MKVYDIVREYFPEASDEYCEYIVHNETGYPSFLHASVHGTHEDCFRRQVWAYKQSKEQGDG